MQSWFGMMDPGLGVRRRDGVPEPGLEAENPSLMTWGCERYQGGVSQNLVSKRSIARDIVGVRENHRWCISARSWSGRLLIGIVGVGEKDVEMYMSEPSLGAVDCPLDFSRGKRFEVETLTLPMHSRLVMAGCWVLA